jgi:hypothetical protein
MNPTKMRDTYGKMMFMLQDTQTHLVHNETGLSFISPILTVYKFLVKKDMLIMLSDILIETATVCITNTTHGKSREQLDNEIMMKHEASQLLIRKYTSGVCIYITIY